MSPNRLPGKDCPLYDDWSKHRDRVMLTVERMDDMHESISEVVQNTRHLKALSDIKDRLVDQATSRDHIHSKYFFRVLWMFSTIIAVLLFILAFLLTGEKLGVILPLHPIPSAGAEETYSTYTDAKPD